MARQLVQAGFEPGNDFSAREFLVVAQLHQLRSTEE